jgi:hypothetical protein
VCSIPIKKRQRENAPFFNSPPQTSRPKNHSARGTAALLLLGANPGPCAAAQGSSSACVARFVAAEMWGCNAPVPRTPSSNKLSPHAHLLWPCPARRWLQQAAVVTSASTSLPSRRRPPSGCQRGLARTRCASLRLPLTPLALKLFFPLLSSSFLLFFSSFHFFPLLSSSSSLLSSFGKKKKKKKAPRRGGVWGGAPGLKTVSTARKKKSGKELKSPNNPPSHSL